MGKKNPYNYGKPLKKRKDSINNVKATQTVIEMLKSKLALRSILTIIVLILVIILIGLVKIVS